jgi:ligand-binding sensor domain-containing protein/signal transduction histidine kinase
MIRSLASRMVAQLFLASVLTFATGFDVWAASISSNNVRFHAFGINEGLSQTTVRAIAQDRNGMMWFGTQDGLNRFDGYEFRTFYRDSEAAGAISDNHVLALAADDARNGIWIGTQSRGLNFLDLKQERFEAFGDSKLGSDCAQVQSLALHANGSLWIACPKGLVHFDPKTKVELLHFAVPGLSHVVLDHQGLAIAVGAQGLVRERAGKITPWPDATWRFGPAHAVETDRAGHVWVGLANEGLLHFDSTGNLLEHFQSLPRAGACFAAPDCKVIVNSLAGNEVRALLINAADELWVSTITGTGLLDRRQAQYVSFLHDPTDQASLPADRAHALFEDRADRIWVGTWRAGVAVHDARTRAVSIARQRNQDRSATGTNSLPASPVRAIWREANGSLWLGVLERGGLVHFDFKRGVLARFENVPENPRSLSNDAVQAVLRSRAGVLWVGTQGGGLNRLESDNSFSHFGRNQAAPFFIPSNTIVSLFEDRDGTLWAGTDDAGLIFRCPSCNEFAQWLDQTGQPLPATVNSIYRSHTGVLWIGMQAQGLVAINSETREIRRFRAQDSQADALSHDSVTSMFEASNGTLWLGTQGGGVNQVLSKGDVFKTPVGFRAVRKANGLGADAIGAILEDELGNLWVSTTVGIATIDSKTMQVRTMSESQGIDRSGYYIGAATKDSDGNLMFGGLNGLIRFNPLDLNHVKVLDKPIFTGMRLANLPLKLHWQDANSPLQESAPYADSLTLNNVQNMWGVEFSSLDFGHSGASRYQFRLRGLSESWVDTAPGQRSATFTNLSPGRYSFEVRQKNADAFSAISSLDLQVRPAPWLSPLAKMLYVTLATLLIGVLGIVMRRRMRERLRNAEQIERSESQLKHALWGSRDELWDLDLRTGQLLSINPLMDLRHDNLKAHRGQMQLEDVVSIAHPQDRARFRLALEAHIDEGTEYFEAAFRMRTHDDDWAWVLSRGRAVERDGKGRAVRLVGTLRDISDVKAVEDELRSLNEQLEDRVSQRTLALSVSNTELSATLEALKSTQRQLVDSEKMASLGNLVAGVAHEINTPLGIGVTAASHLRQETERLARQLQQNTLSKSDLEQFSKTAVEASDLVLKNLDRASKLVRSFKQVAVDQGSEERRNIVLRNYVEEVLFALKPALKRTQHQIAVDIPDTLSMETFPGAISQILFNLVTNSLTHAYPERNDGQIRVNAALKGTDHITLIYSDDGIGMSKTTCARIFEPFFTTKRGQGGSGLGMHVVYNLVTQLLKGTIRCESSEGSGTQIFIEIPLRV